MKRAALLLIVALGGVAHADQAETLFKKGKKLLAEKRYAEACSAFVESDKLDPGIGAKLNVARCYQEWGKLATAYRWYTDAQQLAKQLKDDRAGKIRGLIDDLESQVPRLTVRVPADAVVAGADITLDGKPLDAAQVGSALPVDPGPHEIGYLVDGAHRDKTVPVERGGNSEVTLDLPQRRKDKDKDKDKAVARHKPGDPETPVASADPGHNRRLIGLGVTGAGVVALGVAGLVTLRAHSDYQHAIDHHCAGAKDMCDDTGITATDNARHRANIATIITIGGVAAVAAGVVIFLMAPRSASTSDEHAMYVAPSLDTSGGGLVFGGKF